MDMLFLRHSIGWHGHLRFSPAFQRCVRLLCVALVVALVVNVERPRVDVRFKVAIAVRQIREGVAFHLWFDQDVVDGRARAATQHQQ